MHRALLFNRSRIAEATQTLKNDPHHQRPVECRQASRWPEGKLSYPPLRSRTLAPIPPTAWVDSEVALAPSVIVGPGCIIEGRVTIGDNTRLLANVHIQGPTTIGRNCTFYPFC